MIKLTQWLESNANINFGSFWNDGTITVYINGVRYTYITDPVYHKPWQNLARYKPGTVLNQIKDMVKSGRAKQVIEPQKSVQSTNSTQKSLF